MCVRIHDMQDRASVKPHEVESEFVVENALGLREGDAETKWSY